MESMRVIGVDPSFTSTGFVVVEVVLRGATSPYKVEYKVLHEGRIRTKPGVHYLVRAVTIRDELCRLGAEFKPLFAAVEAPVITTRGTHVIDQGGLFFLLAEEALKIPGIDSVFFPDPSKIKYWALRVLDLSVDEKKKARKGKEYVLKAYRQVHGLAEDVKVQDDIADGYFISELAAIGGLLLQGRDIELDDTQNRFLLDHRKNKGKSKGMLLREGEMYITAAMYREQTGEKE